MNATELSTFNQAQIQEIFFFYQNQLQKKSSRDYPLEKAAKEWIALYSKDFRSRWTSMYKTS